MQKFVASSAELRSWLWMTAFVISTAIPFSLITKDSLQNSQTVTPELAPATVVLSSTNETSFVSNELNIYKTEKNSFKKF